MTTHAKWPAIFGATWLLLLAAAAQAQQQQLQQPPRIGYLYPAGAQQGATLDVMVGGQNLDGADRALCTGPGIQVTVLEHYKPIAQQQAGKLRDRVKELLDGPRDANTLREVAEIRAKLATFQKRPSPAIAETVHLLVTVAKDAEVSTRELRLGTPNGLSNPRTFRVGQLAEFSRKPATVAEDPNAFMNLRPGALGGNAPGNQPRSAVPLPEMAVTLPAVINGQVLPGAVDRYRFAATKGQRLVFAAAARELIPYLADAVPGWFQAAITLRDAKGNEVAYADHFRYEPDPVLYYEVPSDGPYELEIRDSIYRGREDFVYRITAGELPYVTGIFPLGGKAGEQTPLEALGWNLPAGALSWDAKDKGPGVYPFSARKGDWTSNRVPFEVDTLPECLAKKPNSTPETAQAVTMPVIVNGRIERPGEWDMYRIEGKGGEEIVAEVFARRLGSPLDSVLKLTDSSGRQLAFNDDWEDKGVGLETHHADSYIRARLPASGAYFVSIGDAQQQAGPEFAYRLRLSPPRPDFELRVGPSSVNIRGGSSVPLAVYALRRDGFAGEIALSLKGSPAGITLTGGTLPAGQDNVRVTLTAAPTAPAEPVSIALEGRARIDGRQVVRQAVPAEDMMQAFAYRHLVPAQEMDVEVAGAGRFQARNAVRILSATPVRIPAGGTARVQVGMPTSTPRGQIKLELEDPPAGVSIQSVSSALAGSEMVLSADMAKAKPGLKGNLIVNTVLETTPPAPPATATATSGATSAPAAPRPATVRRTTLGVLPAIPFEIVGADGRAGASK
jgi:hypothetical protein